LPKLDPCNGPNSRGFPTAGIGAIPGAPESIISFAMNEFTPRGYISIREALNRVGRGLFPSDWTGEEHKAPGGLLSEDDWLKLKDLPRLRGSGAPGSGATLREPVAKPVAAATPHPTGDPSDPAYQEEYRAHKRLVDARHQLRALLEAGVREAAILDPWTGGLHRVSVALWRRTDAGRLIEEGRAPIPSSPNMGTLLVKDFAEAGAKPIPRAKMEEAIKALQQKTAAESLTRPQQKDFVRKSFPTYHITERQFSEIFQKVSVLPGRPKKPDKKV